MQINRNHESGNEMQSWGLGNFIHPMSLLVIFLLIPMILSLLSQIRIVIIPNPNRVTRVEPSWPDASMMIDEALFLRSRW